MSIITTPFAYYDCHGTSYICDNCHTYNYHEFIACIGDTWQFEDNETYPLLGMDLCRNGEVVIPNFVDHGDFTQSELSFTISDIEQESMFRLINICNGNLTCNYEFKCLYSHLKRDDFIDNLAYMNAILEYVKCIYQTDYGNVVDNNNGSYTINILWNGNQSINSCRCTATLSWVDKKESDFSNNDCFLPTVKRSYKIKCISEDEYINIFQIQTFKLCISINKNHECIKNQNLIKMNWVSIPFGCYTLCNDQYCTSNIKIINSNKTHLDTYHHCGTVLVEARNSNESWTKCRLSINPTNPSIKKTQEISRSSKGEIRKLYTTMDREWYLESNYYPSNTHAFISQLLEKDYVYIEGIFDNNTLVEKKRFVTEDGWNAKWESNIPRIQVAKGEVNILEYNYNYVNEFC